MYVGSKQLQTVHLWPSQGEDVFKDSPLRKVVKRCERCHEGKDLADYTRTVSTADGFNPFCRACHAAINAERRGKTLPQVRSRIQSH